MSKPPAPGARAPAMSPGPATEFYGDRTNYLGELVLAIGAGFQPGLDVLAEVLWSEPRAEINRTSWIAHRARVREVLPTAIAEAQALQDRALRMLGQAALARTK